MELPDHLAGRETRSFCPRAGSEAVYFRNENDDGINNAPPSGTAQYWWALFTPEQRAAVVMASIMELPKSYQSCTIGNYVIVAPDVKLWNDGDIKVELNEDQLAMVQAAPPKETDHGANARKGS